MEYNSIADIYSANQRIREHLTATLETITPDEAISLPEGEKWTIQHIVEHLWMVEFGVSRLCSRLIEAAMADGKPSDGSYSVTDSFAQRAAEIAVIKVEAPDRVQPKGETTIEQSMERMQANRSDLEALRSDLERFDMSGHTFPHPFFGELTAPEWLVMLGWHERRHTQQLQRVLERVRG